MAAFVCLDSLDAKMDETSAQVSVVLKPSFWLVIAIEVFSSSPCSRCNLLDRFGGASPRRVVLVVDDLDPVQA